MGRLTVIPTASVGFFDGSTDLSGGGGTLAPQDVVEFYLQPVSLGTTNYTSDFEMDSSDNISVNNVTTSDASGTIYFDVYAGLNLSGGASSGVETAELNFTSTGAIGDGSTPSSLGLAFANGFGDGPAASTGDSTDLNDDGNLDLGSTGNANPAGWADFCQNPGVIGTATGSGSGDCTNVLLGVLAYNYSDADDGQTAQVTLDSRTGTFAPVFMYELDGVAKADTFHGCRASDLAIGTPVTITYAPPGGLSQVSSAAGGLSQVSSDETGTVPFAPAAVPDVSPPLTISTGTVAIVVAGSGTLVLSGDNTYSRGTDIESGTLQLGSQDALPTGCAVTVDSAGTLDLDGWSPQIAALSDGPDGGGAVTNGAATAVTLTLAPPSGTPSTFSGTIDDGSNGGAVGLIVDGPGTQILAGSNSYSGPTEIIGGVLQAGAEYALSPSSDVTVGQYGTLDLNGFDNEVNTLAGSGTVENSAARTTATVTVGADDTPGLSDMDTTFSGVLQDVGTGQLALDKTGDDTLTLTNANTYTGETTLDEGTLFVAAGGSIVGPVMIEGDGEAFTVTLSQAADCSFSVQYQTVSGTAAAGTDYTTTSGTLDFSAGQMSQTVTVPTRLDGGATGDLNFSLDLGTPTVSDSSVTINGGGASGTATIEEVTGSITIYNPDGTASNDGTVDVGDSVPMTVLTSPAGADGTFTLGYDTNYFTVTTDAAGNDVLNPGDRLSPSNGYTQLYLWGVAATDDPAAAQITLLYVEGDPTVTTVTTATAPAVAFTPTGTMSVTIVPDQNAGRGQIDPMWGEHATVVWNAPSNASKLPYNQVSFLQRVKSTCVYQNFFGSGTYTTGGVWNNDTTNLLNKGCLTVWKKNALPAPTNPVARGIFTSPSPGVSGAIAKIDDSPGQNDRSARQLSLVQVFQDAVYVSDTTSALYGKVLGYIEWGMTTTFNPTTSKESTMYWVSGPSGGATYISKTFPQGTPLDANFVLQWGVAPVNSKTGYPPSPAFIAYYKALGIPIY